MPSTHTERVKKKRENEVLRTKIEQSLAFWVEGGLVGKWWRAFSQVVAEGRFAQVGVVLLGVLGSVCGLLGITGMLEEEGDEEVRAAIERFGREEREDVEMASGRGREGDEGDGEDVGVAVSRDDDEVERDVSALAERNIVEERGGPSSKRPTSPPPQRKSAKKTKRKKAGGDAIDDLFRGLG